MPGSLLEFLFRAYRDGAECTLAELRAYEEFGGLSLLQSLTAIDERLQDEGLCIVPPVNEGEMDQARVVSRAVRDETFEAAYKRALEQDESQEVEYKESLYLKKKVYGNQNIPKSAWVGEEIVFEVVATICSFLNGDGGVLLIGVADDGSSPGIDCELPFIPGNKNDLDQWELHLSNCLKKYIYDFTSVIGYIKRKIIQTGDGNHICVVIVSKRTSSLTVCQTPSEPGSEVVYVRNGNGKAEIKARAIEELIRSRLTS
ncbi:AlbA family DNA-binding domain-containing protein [Parerythrobacter aestuarii]|uniref:AlbA family DNA-binding domain-containing protein n=1 Tax=Parerythrobacter aestuarii TaxID=3020909 RepID=UPI0024DE17E9|nr:ATP-binding protein [Parerythrobacter aestuarii]